MPIFEACFDVPNTDWVKSFRPKKLEMEASPNPVPPGTNPRMNEAKSTFAVSVKAEISGFKGRFPGSEKHRGNSKGQKRGEVL